MKTLVQGVVPPSEVRSPEKERERDTEREEKTKGGGGEPSHLRSPRKPSDGMRSQAPAEVRFLHTLRIENVPAASHSHR